MNGTSLLSTRCLPDWPPASDLLLQGIYAATGLDLFGYRRSSLARRIGARIEQIGLGNVNEYATYCEITPGEYARLAQTILIHVTSFFRDLPVWRALENEFVAPLLESGRDPLHIWCAGCASGEEAYTLAMILAEAGSHKGLAPYFRILATDVSASVVDRARLGVYSDAAISSMPLRLRDIYWTRTSVGWTICPALRAAISFKCHDLTRDPLPRRCDLISCRNILMYFDSALQNRVLTGLVRAIRPGGCLVLGQAEGIPPGVAGFAPINRDQRMFERLPREDHSFSRAAQKDL